MAQYSLEVTMWESMEDLVFESGESFLDGIQRLIDAGKVLIHTKTVLVEANPEKAKEFPGLILILNNYKFNWRNEDDYPFLWGMINVTLV